MSGFNRSLGFLRRHRETVDDKCNNEMLELMKEMAKLTQDVEKEKFPVEDEEDLNELPEYKKEIMREIEKDQKEIDQNFREALKVQKEFELRKKVLGELPSLLHGNEEKLAEVYQRRVKSEVQRLKFTDNFFQQSTTYKDFYHHHWDIHHENEPLPWEDQDQELLIVGGKVKKRCPFSQEIMEEPYKNENCGHHYSMEGVNAALRSGGTVRCPEVGCNAIVTRNVLKLDRRLQAKIQKELEKEKKERDKTQTFDIE